MGALNVNLLTMNLHSLCIISLKPPLFGHTLLKLLCFFFFFFRFVNGVRIFHNEKFPLHLTQKMVVLLYLLAFVFSSSCKRKSALDFRDVLAKVSTKLKTRMMLAGLNYSSFS
ncbi:hypothetical protein ACB098_07G136400 [Castanea mollissima]